MLHCGSAVGARPFTTAAEHARRSIGQNTRVCAERRQDQGVERGKAGAAIKIVVRVGGKKWKGSRKGRHACVRDDCTSTYSTVGGIIHIHMILTLWYLGSLPDLQRYHSALCTQ